jgi:hypothetical protein
MQDGCKVYIESYMASIGLCFMVTWTIFKNHLLKSDLAQNWEIMGTPNVHNHRFNLIFLSCVMSATNPHPYAS